LQTRKFIKILTEMSLTIRLVFASTYLISHHLNNQFDHRHSHLQRIQHPQFSFNLFLFFSFLFYFEIFVLEIDHDFDFDHGS